ncbi:MAG: condensation domain-containing protein, partial [Cyanobacteria bacterium P01_A01_bin.17]
MSLEQLLSDLSQRGIKISVQDDKLRVRAPKGRVTPELRAALHHSKPELLNLLSQQRTVASPAKAANAIPLLSRDAPLTVSTAQERLWLVDQLQPGSSTYNLPMAFRLTGHLDADRLEKSLQALVKRHEVLRTIYPPSGDGPSVVIETTAPALTCIDLQQHSEPEPEVQASGLVTELSKKPFDLAQGPLIHYSLIRLAPNESLLVIVVHHMVADGWSLGLIISEVSAFYNAAGSGEVSFTDLPFQYADFAAWQKQWLASEQLTPQLDYWHQIFTDSPEALKLPLDRPYSTSQSTQGRCQTFNIGSSLSQALIAFCQQEGKSQFTVLLASFKALLHCYSGQKDLIVCSPVAGRSSDTQQLIGYFNNILPLRTQVSSHQTFRDLIQQEQKTVTAIYDYPDVPLQQIANFPNLAGISLSRALFVLQSQQSGPQQALTIDEVTAQPLTKEEMGVDTADFDLAIFVEPAPNQFGGYIQYRTELFEPSTVESLFRHWVILLERALEQPEATLSELQPLGTVERQRLKDKVDTLNQLLAEAEQDQAHYVA